MEALRVAQGASTYIVKSSNASGETAFGQVYGVLAIRNGDLTIPTDAAGRHQGLFRASRPAPLDPGVEGSRARSGSQRPSRRDRVLRRVRRAAFGHCRHPVVARDAGRRSACADRRAALERPDAQAAGLGAERGVDGDGAHLRGAGGDDLDPWRPTSRRSSIAAVLAAIVAVSWFAFSRHGLLIEPTYPAFSAAAVYFAGVSTLYAVKRHQEREIRSAFGRFVSPAVVSRLAEMPGALELGGLQRELTLLFCDIRVVHDHLGGVQRVGAHPFPQRISDADDRRHSRPRGHDRQIHGRRDHGVLERAARRSRSCGARGRIGAGDAARRWSR